MLLHGPFARKHRVRAVVIETGQSVVIELQQRNDTEKIRGVDVARGMTAIRGVDVAMGDHGTRI